MDKFHPLISIITPLYCSERFIGATIESVQKQTYCNYEHIIIDDCSSDDSYEIAKTFAEKDGRIKLFRNERNLRVAYTRNRGLDFAIGDYILFLDSDDILSEDALEILVKCIMRNPDASIYTASYQKISDSGNELLGIIHPPSYTNYKRMLKTCTMAPLTTLVSRAIIGEHRMKNIPHEDYLFWLEILRDKGCSCYGYSEKPLGYYRLTSNSLSRNKFKTFRYQWNIYRNEIKLNFLSSSFYFIFYAINGLYKYLK
ncbi:glycosyltransferase family 2 protein [Bacteroides faecichinchillae]|uniref:glycosyltransferase family 2 protein n=1 Tax=Bacteroides faecichinchillae TaxID=871325 RepID=UPI003511AF0C